jgi:signal transduction histidine kinase
MSGAGAQKQTLNNAAQSIFAVFKLSPKTKLVYNKITDHDAQIDGGRADGQIVRSESDPVPEGVIIVDEKNRVQCFNAAARALFAESAPLAAGSPAPEVLLSGADELTLDIGGAARQIAVRAITFEQRPSMRLICLHDITEQKRLQEAEREQRALIEALHEVGARLNSLTSLDEVLKGILDQIARVVPYDAGTISLIDKDEAYVASERGYSQRGFNVLGARFPIASTENIKQVFSTQRPFLISDAQLEPTWVKTPATAWVRGHVTVPLKIGGAVIGFLHLESAQPSHFTAQHYERLKTFADHIAIAVCNAKLLDDYARHTAELEAIIEARTASLREALAKEQSISALRARFLSMVSHEFKNPLASILLSTDMIKRYAQRMTPERLREYIESIQAQISSLNMMIDDILFAHRAEQVGFRFSPHPVDLRRFCERVVHDIMPLAGARHRIEIVVTENCGWVMLDERLLQRALNNLLTNAIKYSPEGGTVVMRADCGADEVRLQVTDSGIGIPEEDLPHIFEHFYRAGNAENIPGTGIGLTIAKQAVELHGGSIEVRSQRGVGTTFTICLPLSHPQHNR